MLGFFRRGKAKHKSVVQPSNNGANDISSSTASTSSSTAPVRPWARTSSLEMTLHVAARLNSLAQVQHLVEKQNANVEATDSMGWTALYFACLYGHLDIVRYLVTRGGANIEATSHNGSTAFHAACSCGWVNVMRYLAESGAKVGATDEGGWTALHWACFKGHIAAVRYLVETCQVNVHVVAADGTTALRLAKSNRHDEIATYLLSKSTAERKVRAATPTMTSNATTYISIPVPATTTHQSSVLEATKALHEAVQNKNLAKVEHLVRTLPVNAVNSADHRGWTALHWACLKGHLGMVQFLVEACGANVQATTDVGWTALHYASRYGHLQVVKYLVETGRADVQAVTNLNKTAVGLAKSKGYDNVVTYLQSLSVLRDACSAGQAATSITSSAPMSTAVPQPSTSVLLSEITQTLHEAIQNKNMAKAGILVKTKNADVNAVDKNGWTALHWACLKGHLEMVQYLIQDCGANVRATTAVGWTPLHYASRYGYMDVVQYLVEKCQANIEAADHVGWTALHYSCRNNHLGIVGYLVETCGADIQTATKDNKTALDVAKSRGHGDVVSYLQRQLARDSNLVPLPITGTFGASDTAAGNSEPSTPNSANPTTVAPSQSTSIGSVSSASNTPPTFDHLSGMLQQQNQRLEEFFTNFDHGRFSQDQHDVLILVIGGACKSKEEEEEKQAILASREHAEFYLLLARKLFCMIHAFEALSTNMLVHGSGGSVRSITTRLLQENGCDFVKGTKIGAMLSDIVGWVKKNVACVPFLDTVGSICQLMLTLKDERDRYMSIANIADFATMASIQQSNGDGLRTTVERFARVMVRARAGMPSTPFAETRDEFGRCKQLMLKILAESGNTPAKEQACQAADCCFAHLMRPTTGSSLHDLLNTPTLACSTRIHEILAAATLETTIEDIQKLGRISPAGSSKPNVKVPIPSSALTLNARSKQLRAPACGTDGTAVWERSADEGETNVRHDAEIIEKLCKDVSILKKQVKVASPPVNLEAGGGLVYADTREKYEDKVNGLANQGMDHKEQITALTEELARSREEQEAMRVAQEAMCEKLENMEKALETSKVNRNRRRFYG